MIKVYMSEEEALAIIDALESTFGEDTERDSVLGELFESIDNRLETLRKGREAEKS